MVEVPGGGDERPVRAFSVVIPLYNKRDFVRGTILSVLNQDYASFEIILVDDGSTDDSLSQIADVRDGRLRIIEKANGGPGEARNLGIAQARFEWVAFLDADDVWYPDHLSELARAIAAFPYVGMAATAYVKRPVVRELPPRLPSRTAFRQLNYFEACRRRSAVWTSALAVRRGVFEQVGGFRSFYPGEDTDMWVRAGLYFPLAISSRVTAIYTVETGGLSDGFAQRRQLRAQSADRELDRPLAQLLRAALDDPAFRALHGSIRAYSDARLLTVARNATFLGDQHRARQALRGLARKSGYYYLWYAAIAHSPKMVFAAAHAVWRGGRAMLRRIPLRNRRGRKIADDARQRG